MGKPNGKQMPVLAPKTILVVEDDVLIRLSMADELMGAGFRVIQAATADEALKILNSSFEPDVVLTDIRMPGSLDGLALATRVRAQWPHLKIIVISSELPTDLPTAVADAFYAKPFNLSIVLTCIAQLLGLQQPTLGHSE